MIVKWKGNNGEYFSNSELNSLPEAGSGHWNVLLIVLCKIAQTQIGWTASVGSDVQPLQETFCLCGGPDSDCTTLTYEKALIYFILWLPWLYVWSQNSMTALHLAPSIFLLTLYNLQVSAEGKQVSSSRCGWWVPVDLQFKARDFFFFFLVQPNPTSNFSTTLPPTCLACSLIFVPFAHKFPQMNIWDIQFTEQPCVYWVGMAHRCILNTNSMTSTENCWNWENCTGFYLRVKGLWILFNNFLDFSFLISNLLIYLPIICGYYVIKRWETQEVWPFCNPQCDFKSS